MLELPREKLVYVDEMGINLVMTMRFARAPQGERALSRLPFIRRSNISVVAAIRESGVVTWRPKDEAVNEEWFTMFVTDHLVPKLTPGDFVVLDNIAFHKCDAVREVIEAAGAHVLFTPPYSPEMNAIEEVFSIVKAKLRRISARKLADLIDALRVAFSIPSTTLRKLVSHALEHAAQLL